MLLFKEFEKVKSSDWKWTMADDYPPKNGLKVFSCFSCGGGSTMGYKLAGCDVIGCCEIDKRMMDVYRKNHKPKHEFLMDIRQFNELEDLPKELYNLDILDGSPPCTPFSTSGLREKTWGKQKVFKEGQAKQVLDDLCFEFIATADKLKPKVVLMENVEGLTLGNAWSYVQRIYKAFADIGYTVKHYLLKGEEMGLPQKRHRVVFIAIRNDIKFNIDKLNLEFDYEPIPFGVIKEGDGRPLLKGGRYDRLLNYATDDDKTLSHIVQRVEGKVSFFSVKIIRDEDVCPTIVTSPSNFVRYPEKSYISNQDIANASSFPRDYDYNGQQVSYICGMSVPPLMIKRVVTRMIESGLFR